MIKVYYETINSVTEHIENPDKTLYDFMEEHSIIIQGALQGLANGLMITPEMAMSTLGNIAINDTVRITVVMKANNAYELLMVDGVTIVRSSIDLADIEMAEQLNPECLKLEDEHGNQVFGIGIAQEYTVGKNGITFNPTAGRNGKATSVIVDAETSEEIFTRHYDALKKLEQIENEFDAKMASYKEAHEKFASKIIVV